ncbi:thioesterase family protein [Nocardia sp. NPDC050710]|uniref:acyl-CoA thioesterase n=1 Tax=Nocardia sp. NPDC050710 TaxID=3157220 RepID=UPI0033DB6038
MVSAAATVGVECIEPAEVHLDDLDFMGNLHNGRYALLIERALVAVWARAGYSIVDGVPTHPDVVHVVLEQTIRYRSPVRGVGRVAVRFWLKHLGKSSMVFDFQVASTDGHTVHAEGTRTEVNIDLASLRSAPWADATRELADSLFERSPIAERPAASETNDQ